jgi:hypothetical protein
MTRFSISLPRRQELGVSTGQAVVVLPDGKDLGYIALDNGVSQAYLTSSRADLTSLSPVASLAQKK